MRFGASPSVSSTSSAIAARTGDGRCGVQRANHDIVEHAQAGEGLDDLKRAADTCAAHFIGPPAVDALPFSVTDPLSGL
jgi:hypothetical protein